MKKTYQKGNIMLVMTLFVAIIGLIAISGVIKTVVRSHRDSQNAFNSEQSYATAESGVEDVLYRMKNTLSYDDQEILTLGGATTTTNVVTSAFTKSISSLGIYKEKNSALNIDLITGVGASFNYGMQSGQGGVTFSNNAGIIGNIYTNGPIVGSSGVYITGSAVAANGAAAAVDQTYGKTVLSNVDTVFRNATATQDATQSFLITTTGPLSRASLYIKKVGSPTNATVTIRTNNAGNPSGTVVATGTLNSSLVSTSYGWVDVSFSSSPTLSGATTYWLVIDNSSTSTSNYYVWAGNSTYANGQAKVGTVGGTWYTSSPQITSGTDFFFEIYTGGVNGSISSVIVGTGSTGDAWANTVTGSTVRGALYCQTGSSNNKSCNTTRADPPQQDFPISDANITDWKNTAAANGVSNGNMTISSNTTIGSKKIVGNLTVNGNVTLTLGGSVWVTGNISVSNGGVIKFASSYGATGGMIIADGTISIDNNGDMTGSGTTGSYILAISTNTGSNAISVSNNTTTVILYAPHGTVNLSNNANARQITGYKINLTNNATVTYDSGLVSKSFSSGPSGGWDIASWKDGD